VHGRRPPRGIVLDMDSSVSPTHGEQENSVWNGHHACAYYHPLFVFNQFGDLERCDLRPGNVHSADGWDGVLKPVVARYQGKVSRIYFRADAGSPHRPPPRTKCVGAKQRRFTLGTTKSLGADEARKQAKRKLAAVTLGEDPQALKEATRAKAANTLSAIIETYLEIKLVTLRPKSFAETARYLRRYWKPLHGVPVHAVSRTDVAARLAKITTANGTVAATRARAALSALFAWAIREGIADTNPVIGTNRPDGRQAEAKTRERVLSNRELAEIWRACGNDDYGRIIRLLSLTGQRRNEVGGMAWSELDLERGTWTIPSHRTKNGRAHVIAFPHAALPILARVERRTWTDRLFGRSENGFGGWSKAKKALDQRVAEKQGVPERLEPWCVHDIRRTVATRMADLGILPHVIEALLNHISGHKSGVARVYNRSTYERETRAALALWSDHLCTIVDGAKAQIIPLLSA
jgi:integrase